MTLHARAELAVPALLAVAGVAAVTGGLSYGISADNGQVGTGFLPVAAGGVLAALAVAEVVSARRRQVAAAHGEHRQSRVEAIADVPEGAIDTHDPDQDILGRTAAQRVRILAMVAVLLVLAVVLVPVVGFLLSFGGLLLTVTMVVERMGVLKSVAATVIAVGLIWYVFGQFLSVPLPQGLLGLI